MIKLLTCPECGSAKVRVSECSSYDANTEPITYGPFDVTFMGPGVWAGIPDELPPELVGKKVYVTSAPQPVELSPKFGEEE